jgi:hypothetical protein
VYATSEWRYRYTDHISNGLMMAAAHRYSDSTDITDARCYCGSPINKPLRSHIAMLPKFPAKIFRASVIWHMMSLARCYCDQTHLSVTQHSM